MAHNSRQMLIRPNVRFGSKADMCNAQAHVRFTPKSGHTAQGGRHHGQLVQDLRPPTSAVELSHGIRVPARDPVLDHPAEQLPSRVVVILVGIARTLLPRLDSEDAKLNEERCTLRSLLPAVIGEHALEVISNLVIFQADLES